MMSTNEREQVTVSAAMQAPVLLQRLMVVRKCSKIGKAHARIFDTTSKYPEHAMQQYVLLAWHKQVYEEKSPGFSNIVFYLSYIVRHLS